MNTSIDEDNKDFIEIHNQNGFHDTSNAVNNETNHKAEAISSSVCVSIEPNHESEIYELKYDGQEVYKEPLTYSENLAQLISKIDFGEIEESGKKKLSESAQKSQDKNEIITARKFYQNIHERIKLAFDEVCVLLDCLTIAKAEKLMAVETALFNEDPVSDVSDKTLSVVLKKKNIEKVKTILKKSLDKISNDVEYSNIKFHLELYRARQIWRIKKVGLKFNCDLSYRSVGCLNAIKANVELLKNDIVTPTQQGENGVSQNAARRQYLNVIIPDEFKDYAYIQVRIVKSNKKQKNNVLFDRKFSLFTYNGTNASQSWQEVLEREQNSIYCKEIYNQLLREIFDPNSTLQLRPIIIGNSIQIMINMEFDLIISLIHTQDKTCGNQVYPGDYNFDNAILEYYLHCLLKKSFDQNFFHYEQRPVTSMFAHNIQVKIAGMAYSNLNYDEEDSVISLPQHIGHLLNKKKKINLLQSIKEKAEHLLIRRKVLRILSKISKKVSEPHMFIEQSAWNSATSTDIIVTISSNYYEILAKSFFHVIIKQSQVSILNRSTNISISFTDSIDDLHDYFFDQCCFHQINLITTLSQLFGWKVLGNSFINELNKKSMTGMALLYNDNFSKKIGIKLGPVNEIQLYVNQYNCTDEKNIEIDQSLKSLLGDSSANWLFIKDNFAPVDIESYPGFTKIQKFELFLAHYSTSEFVR